VCGIAGSLSLDGQPVTHDAVKAITDAPAPVAASRLS